jgi:hypothetical protein
VYGEYIAPALEAAGLEAFRADEEIRAGERLPNSFRYRVTDFGFRAALFFTRLNYRLLRPGIAAAIPGLRAIAHAPVLAKDAPIPRAVQTVGQTSAGPILGGLHHQYI